VVPQLTDPRRQEDVVHDLGSLIRTSVLLAAQGWRDHDDADALRDDPALRLAVSSAAGQTPLMRARGLPSQPTLSRFAAIMAAPANQSVLREAVLELGCTSSDNLGRLSGFRIGGSGPSLIEIMRFQFCGASAV